MNSKTKRVETVWGAIGAWLGDVLEYLLEERRIAAARRELERMNDHLLRDIGLPRELIPEFVRKGRSSRPSLAERIREVRRLRKCRVAKKACGCECR